MGNILRLHGMAPAPKRSQNTNWKDFIASHTTVLAGIGFFTVKVLTWQSLLRTTSYSSFTWRPGA